MTTAQERPSIASQGEIGAAELSVRGPRGGAGPYPYKAQLTPGQESCNNEAVHCVGWGATPGLWSALIDYKTQIPSKPLRWKAVLLLKVGGLSWKYSAG